MRKTSALIAATTLAAAGVALPAAAQAAAANPDTAPTALTAPTATTTPTAVPAFDYSDCPQLPPGVDPARWRCEVLVASGTVTIGASTAPFRFDRVTHAEGPMPDGTPGQVFGGFRAPRLPVEGRQSGDGHGPKLWMQPRLISPPDFYSQGAMSLAFALSGPKLGDRCSIGTGDAPVQVVAGRVPGTTEWISQNPPIITFEVQDATLAVPEVSGCGRASGTLDRRFGLPSPSGANRVDATAFYSFKTYDHL
ncbi:hypothetical protein [Catenulispora subtropica]|uniref:Secreted protein n=1 Tax=Catenulispora subtropica TaxID=450798 RepID=A0ABN2R1G1_9ACTN